VPRLTGTLVLALLTTTAGPRLGLWDAAAARAWASSDLAALRSRPVRALLASALVLPSARWAEPVAGLVVALGPLEHRLGARRALLVVASGHVLGTLVTQGAVAVQVQRGRLPAGAARQVDVGSSYVTGTAAGAALGLLPRRARGVLAAAGTAGLLASVLRRPEVDSWGHLLCFAVGLAWSPTVERAGHGRLPSRP
jgi:membrane associated rhomboid family serine protease